jgi:hypothetical protein
LVYYVVHKKIEKIVSFTSTALTQALALYSQQAVAGPMGSPNRHTLDFGPKIL